MVYNIRPRGILRELLIAIVILFNAICLLANEIMPSIHNFGDNLVVLIFLLGTVICLLNRKILLRRFLLINVSILFWMLASFVFYDFDEYIFSVLVNYLVWGIFITFFMTLEYDMQKTLNVALPIASVILFLDLIFDGVDQYETMTWTYSVFPCICLCFTHMFLCKGQFGKLRWIFYIPAILILPRFFAEANRGGWVSMIVLFYLLTAKIRIHRDTKLRNRVLWNLLFITLIILATFFYDWIVISLYKTMVALDIRIYAIQKMYRGILADNITNNRTELYKFAWNGFLSSPIWGHGIGAFAVKHGGWPHNFILQLLYEGGILLFLLVMIPLCRTVIAVMKSNAIITTDYAMFVCLFTTSVPRLFVSTELWKVQGFWLLLAFGMMRLPHIRNSPQED